MGDGESWSRQRIDFSGLPEMVRTFLQMAAGAADIPVTRLLGQSPAGMSATGSSDTRNYYDMISSRQELDLRPQLERLDALLLRSAGVDPEALSFSFRPLWQLTGAEQAAVALSKAQTTAVYAGLNLWPVAVKSALVQGQLLEDGTYPNAAAVFGASKAVQGADLKPARPVVDYRPDQPRDPQGQWTEGAGGTARAVLSSPLPSAIWRGHPASGIRPTVLAANIHADPSTGGAEEELRKEEEQQRFRPVELLPPIAPKVEPGGEVELPEPLGFPSAQSELPPFVGPGPFARRAIPVESSGRLSSAKQKELNADGKAFGCHTCGTRTPGTRLGNWIGDHQEPTGLVKPGDSQYILPHWQMCSNRQGDS